MAGEVTAARTGRAGRRSRYPAAVGSGVTSTAWNSASSVAAQQPSTNARTIVGCRRTTTTAAARSPARRSLCSGS
ncbi:hypothetical protein ACFV4M_09350 [Kitasatospora indigofera]|uniref:hypothetical protein n=1 Tax=Kitasatospora indigofera TaxID=67307 RepID=UPI00364DDE7F